MGDAKACPVLRTTGAAEAYRQAERLCALLEHIDDRVRLFAETRTPGEARRMALLVPEAALNCAEYREDPATGEPLSLDPDVTTPNDMELGAHPPLVFSGDAERGDVEERFLAALGEGVATAERHGRRPDGPETDSYGHWNRDGVQVVFHGDEAQYDDRWTEDHTVFAHATESGDLERARKLAAHIGGEVLGEARPGR